MIKTAKRKAVSSRCMIARKFENTRPLTIKPKTIEPKNKCKITIEHATIINNMSGKDFITLYTNLPDPRSKELRRDDLKLVLYFSVDSGCGERYVKENFKIAPSIVDKFPEEY